MTRRGFAFAGHIDVLDRWGRERRVKLRLVAGPLYWEKRAAMAAVAPPVSPRAEGFTG